MKPKVFGGVQFIQKSVELKIGDRVTILDEFDIPQSKNPKLTQGFLLGTVEMNGEKYLLGLNKTSYKTIAKDYGIDTTDWEGKELEYNGKVKMGGMEGILWSPVV